MAVNSYRVLRDLAQAGHGIARIPEAYTVSLRRAGELKAVLEHHADVRVGWHAVYPSARHLSVRLRILLEVLEAHLRDAPVEP